MGGQESNYINRRALNGNWGHIMASQKPARFDLMQNCDLPPPSKLFMGSDKTVMSSMNNKVVGKQHDSKEFGCCTCGNESEGDKLELLKALQSSQTRAREAEKKAAVLSKERDSLSNALLQEAMRLFAYRQQVRLLQFQVPNLQRGTARSHKEEEDGEERVGLAWILAMALSFGIGIGTVLACRCFL